MDQLPDFWRTEVFHPLSVHFPIVLLLMATLFKLIGLWSSKITWDHGGRFLLILGVLGVWVSIYTGNLADGIVSRQLCDPTVLKEHENFAYTTAWIFTAALAIDILMRFIDLIKTKIVSIVLVILMIAGSGSLAYVGHLGAELVYQQAAGVNIPSEDCSEFN
ncbi:putative membrane protein [Christiangramia gaetbulicola]|uniref:Putative membrane protein n=1 Tax=Christiangramia gaetbulicola TaxID=703340 RepID=A0A2T6AHX0_9FLAO|nr:putative membrane protein [Christiangramia gaetbulicola]